MSGMKELGRLGENKARVVPFDVSEMLRGFPGASFTVLNKRPNDMFSYPIGSGNVRLEGTTLYWSVTSADVAQEGNGYCEVRASVDDVVMKTEVYTTLIGHALDGSGTPPPPWRSYIDQVAADAYRAEAAAELLEHPGAEAETLSPGSQATASYANGTFSFGIPEGVQGETGNGISSTVLNPDYTLTINYTDGGHDTTESIRGEKGETGDVGLSLFDVNGDMELIMAWNDASDVPDFAINDDMELEVLV